MKKIIPLLLALVMILSFAACGSQGEKDGQIDESIINNEQPEDSEQDANEPEQTEDEEKDVEEPEQTEEITEPVEDETSEEPKEETPAFDTGWAGAEYVMPIPAPPVDDFVVTEIGARFGGVAIQIFANNVENLTDDDVVTYRYTLESIGFVNGIYERDFDSSHGYEFSAQNENGDIVYINSTESYFVLQFEFSE